MAALDLSTVAQLTYPELHSVDFARIVAELDAVMSRLRGSDVVITWDCDDLVTFDVPETRILLSWSETGRRGIAGCLTVSVGPNPKAEAPEVTAEHDILCSRLVERIQGRYEPLAVLWHQVEGPVDANYVDELADHLPNPAPQDLPPIETIVDNLSRADQRMAEARANLSHPRAVRTAELSEIAMDPAVREEAIAAATSNVTELRARMEARRPVRPIRPTEAAPSHAEAANDRPDLPLPRSAELAKLREALYPPEVEELAPTADEKPVYSTQMRLAAHAMNATLIVVYAPLGAAVMTYSLLRGEDMRLSGRVMALVGTFFALSQTPVGQTMAAMAQALS